MESILWALDLLAVLFLCRWALRTDIAESKGQGSARAQDPTPPSTPRQK